MAEFKREATTLREELYNIAAEVKAAKIKAAKERRKAVNAYLEDICRKTACKGRFRVSIPNEVEIGSDGKLLTYEELKDFGEENDIKVIPVCADGTIDCYEYMAVLDFGL